MKAKKVLALILLSAMMLSFASCSTYELVFHLNIPENTGNVNQDVTPEPDNNTPVETPTQNTETPTQNTETPSAGEENTSATAQTPSTGAPTEKAEIVKLYCSAYNKMAEAKTLKKVYDYTSNYNNILNIDGGNKILETTANTLMGMFMKENTDQFDVKVTDIPPVGIGTLDINPSLISKATCADKGTYYEVVIYSTGTDSKYEIDSAPGTGSAGSFAPLLRTEDVSGAAEGYIEFTGLHSWYATATATAKIDKATGRMTALELKTPCVLHFDTVSAVKIVNVGACEVGLLFHQKFEATY